LVQRARSLLVEGRAILASPAPRERHGQDDAVTDDVLGLYEILRGRLAAIEGDEVGELLGEISEAVEELSRLTEDLRRVRDLRRALGDPRGLAG
jgi:hypothetical protein